MRRPKGIDRIMEENTLTAPPLGDTAAEAQVERPSAPAAPAKGFHELTKTERKDFLATGKIKGPKVDPDATPADSSPAPSGEQTDEIASKIEAASEPAKPEKKPKKPVDTRYEEILADRHRERDRADRAERELDRLRADAKPKADALTDSSPAAKPSETAEQRWKRIAKLPNAPRAETFQGDMDEYTAAMAEFVASTVSEEKFEQMFAERATQSRAEQEFAQTAEAAIGRAEARATADKAAHPDIVARISESFKATPAARFLPPDQVRPHHIAKDLITFECEHPLQLAAFYSSEEGLAELKGMTSAEAMRRAIYVRDASYGKPSHSSQVKQPPSKPFTTAPEPSSKVEARPSVSDPLSKEQPPGSFRDFMRLMDDKEGVQSRYRR